MTKKIEEQVEQNEVVENEIVQAENEEATAPVNDDEDASSDDEDVEEVVAKPKKQLKKKSEDPKAEADEDFDWENFASEKGVSSKKREELEAMYDNTLSTIQEKECVDGIVISMNKREVVVNIGYKSDAVVSMNEFRYNPDLKIGDTVEVYVESLEDKKGQLTLSHKKARSLRSWDRVNEALEKDEVIKGFIKCRTKGGMIVDVFGIEAFLPGSQIDVKPIRDYDVYVGKYMEFKVVKI
nr:S1 RNA-binding domain-containing protein [Prolixibacteraceae bacterium]